MLLFQRLAVVRVLLLQAPLFCERLISRATLMLLRDSFYYHRSLTSNQSKYGHVVGASAKGSRGRLRANRVFFWCQRTHFSYRNTPCRPMKKETQLFTHLLVVERTLPPSSLVFVAGGCFSVLVRQSS
jgi:hypothetical protein